MDFSWSDQQLAFRDEVEGFAATLNDNLIDRDRNGEFSHALWQRCAEFGIQGMLVDEAYSNAPAQPVTTAALALEGFGYRCHDNGLALALGAQMWSVQGPIEQFGTEEQKERFLTPMCRGDLIGVHGLTEPGSGSDAFSLSTHAKPVEGGYVLNGFKHYITLAPVADVALVFATTNPDLGKWGVTAFLVECEADGASRSPVREKMGLRTVPIGSLTFTDCFVPEENRIGPEGAGVSIAHGSLEVERCLIFAGHLGAMQRQLEETISFAKDRKRFGQSIGTFQSVSNRIVEMRLRIETTRLLLYKTAWMMETDQRANIETALLKLHMTESFLASSLDAIRTRGGEGYMTADEVERDLRDAVGGVIYAGTSDLQRNIVARLLGL